MAKNARAIRPSTFQATADVARAEFAFAQFVMLTPYATTVNFEACEKRLGREAAHVGGVPITRHWLIPQERRPKVHVPHAVMYADEIRGTQAVWDEAYPLRRDWARSRCTDNSGTVGFMLIRSYTVRCTRTGALRPTAHWRVGQIARRA